MLLLRLQAEKPTYLGVSGQLVLEHRMVGVHRTRNPPALLSRLAHVRSAELSAVLAPALASWGRRKDSPQGQGEDKLRGCFEDFRGSGFGFPASGYMDMVVAVMLRAKEILMSHVLSEETGFRQNRLLLLVPQFQGSVTVLACPTVVQCRKD